MTSERLTYEPVTHAAVGELHRLVQDDHVRRYLMDGQLFPLEWTEDRVRGSVELFDRRGVGLWLARQRETGELVGFCGFLAIPSMDEEPQLVYALFERFAGRGYATEMAGAAIAAARHRPGFATIVAAVDAVNAASMRVLEKLGFRRVAVRAGSFGDLISLRLESDSALRDHSHEHADRQTR